jgi:hypothetical protein
MTALSDLRSHPLTMALAVAVPVEMAALAALDDELRAVQIGRHTGLAVAGVLGEHGDQLLYGGRHCVETFAAVARGLACLAFASGGVTVFGMHWCARHELCLEADAAIARRVQAEPAGGRSCS